MRGFDVKRKIDANNALIEKLMTPNQYTLNNTIRDLLKENEEYQNQCPHEYEEGYCIYCYKEER